MAQLASLADQLRAAWEASELTLDQLLARAGLDMTRVSLSRKLRGEQILTTEECEALALALGVEVSTGAATA